MQTPPTRDMLCLATKEKPILTPFDKVSHPPLLRFEFHFLSLTHHLPPNSSILTPACEINLSKLIPLISNKSF